MAATISTGNSCHKRGSTLCYGVTFMSLGLLREPPPARSQATAGNNWEGVQAPQRITPGIFSSSWNRGGAA